MTTTKSNRITSIDVLRGFALLGILLMNIMGYAMNDFAYSNPTVAGGEGFNKLIHGVNHVVADQKMMALFSMLFGASILLHTETRKRKGQRVFLPYFSRTFWLFVLGFGHLLLIWRGDILGLYAILSVPLFILRKLPAYILLPLGLIVFSLSAYFEFNAQSQLATLDEASQIALESWWEPTPETLAEDIAVYTKDPYQKQVVDRFNNFFGTGESTAGESLWSSTIGQDYMTRALGMMLIGMALFKMGVLSAEKSPLFYKCLAIFGLSIGYSIALVGLLRNYANAWAWETTMIGGRIINNIATPFVAFGYVGLLMGWMIRPSHSQLEQRIQDSLAAVGRTALTCYITQSIIGTFIFYGFGLGLYGSVNRVGQLLIVFAIWAVQLTTASLWLKHFHYGPLEWVWRSLTLLKPQPVLIKS